jgi:hypothetical protein
VPGKAEKTRQKTLGETDSILLELPHLEYGEWLISALFEIGPTEIAGMGAMQPISQTEIAAYSANHGIAWMPWEVTTLRKLSEAYAMIRSTSTDQHAPPPYQPAFEATVAQRASVDSFFRGLAARQSQKGIK